VRFKASELRAKLGLSDPDDDDEVIGGQPSAAPAPAQNRRARLQSSTAFNREQVADEGPYPALDEIEYEALKDWKPQMGALLDPVIEVIQQAGSYAEALEALALIAPRMEAGPLIDGLVQSTFKARALGDVTDGSGG
jgi:phage gp29-like protein